MTTDDLILVRVVKDLIYTESGAVLGVVISPTDSILMTKDDCRMYLSPLSE